MQRLLQSSRRQRCSSRRPRERTSRRAPSRRWSARGWLHRTPQSEVRWDNASARTWSTSGAVLVGRTWRPLQVASRLCGCQADCVITEPEHHHGNDRSFT